MDEKEFSKDLTTSVSNSLSNAASNAMDKEGVDDEFMYDVAEDNNIRKVDGATAVHKVLEMRDRLRMKEEADREKILNDMKQEVQSSITSIDKDVSVIDAKKQDADDGVDLKSITQGALKGIVCQYETDNDVTTETANSTAVKGFLSLTL